MPRCIDEKRKSSVDAFPPPLSLHPAHIGCRPREPPEEEEPLEEVVVGGSEFLHGLYIPTSQSIIYGSRKEVGGGESWANFRFPPPPPPVFFRKKEKRKTKKRKCPIFFLSEYPAAIMVATTPTRGGRRRGAGVKKLFLPQNGQKPAEIKGLAVSLSC